MRSSAPVRAWPYLAVLRCSVCLISAASPSLELINNQPFAIRLPIEIRDLSLGEGDWETSRGQAVQQSGSNVVLIADLPPDGREQFHFRGAMGGQAQHEFG